MSFVTGLTCRECGKLYPKEALVACVDCFAPLEVSYDYEAVGKIISRKILESREKTIWKYRELLPLDAPPKVGLTSGGTPLVRAERLGKVLGLSQLYLKNDGVNSPTLSFKDRLTAVAINKALEFRMAAVGCASTGNLANSVAANAAAAGLPAYIVIPENLEPSKVIGTMVYGVNLIAVQGTYDDVNRLCMQIADRHSWGFVNVNLRPYYAEGSKSFAFEVAEQLGWRAPDAIVVPMAGGSLITKIKKGFQEFQKLGLIPEKKTRLFGAQGSGCNPIVTAVKKGVLEIQPVKPNTIAKSLAIGNPADGYYASGMIQESGGWAEDATDEEIVAGIRLVAETEGIFTETAGGVTIAAAQKLIRQGRIHPEELVVLSLTGNGLKTQEVVALESPKKIPARLDAFEKLLAEQDQAKQESRQKVSLRAS